MTRHWGFFLLLLTIWSIRPATASDKVIIDGSTTVNNVCFNGGIEKYKDLQNVGFDVIVTNSGRGLMALSDEKSDIAMISSDLPTLIKELNENNGNSLSEGDYSVYSLGKRKVLFIVNPENPMQDITRQQAKDLFTGKIKNWSELGAHGLGKVKIVTEQETGGMYSIVLDQVTDNTPLTEDKISIQNAPQIAIVVSQLPDSFGMLSSATPEDQRLSARPLHTTDFEAVQDLSFVTRKSDDRENVKQVLSAVLEGCKN